MSLRRLRTDHIDLYYAHEDDRAVPLADTVAAFDALARAGKVRYVAASNYSAPRLADALAAARRQDLAGFVALQVHYNLVHRAEYGLPFIPSVAPAGVQGQRWALHAVPVQPQVRLGLSNETEMVPPGTIVKWATSWMLTVLPSEPVAWAENVNVAFAFCSFMLKLSQAVACPV